MTGPYRSAAELFKERKRRQKGERFLERVPNADGKCVAGGVGAQLVERVNRVNVRPLGQKMVVTERGSVAKAVGRRGRPGPLRTRPLCKQEVGR